MFLSGTVMGYSVFSNYIPIPPATYYNKVSLFGEQTIKYLWIKDSSFTQTEINNIKTINSTPVWDNNTLLLTYFNKNTINAGVINTLDKPILNWAVYRQKVGSNKLDLIKKVPYGTFIINDYMPQNNTSYIYTIFPETDTEIGAGLQSDIITTDWWNWSLMSLSSTSIDNQFIIDSMWLFDLNLESSELKQNLDKTVFPTFNQFPKVSSGKRNYLSGNIKCYIGDIQQINGVDTYVDTVQTQQDFITFMNNGKRKILKDRKGNIMELELIDNSLKMDDILVEQPTTLNFSFVQVGDASNISVTN